MKLIVNKLNLQQQVIVKLLLVADVVTLNAFYKLIMNLVCHTLYTLQFKDVFAFAQIGQNST